MSDDSPTPADAEPAAEAVHAPAQLGEAIKPPPSGPEAGVVPTGPSGQVEGASVVDPESFGDDLPEAAESDSGAEPVAPALPALAGVEPPADEEDAAPPAPESKKKWYVVKVTSNREDSIKAAIERRVRIEGLEEYYGQIAIPVEEFIEKKKVSTRDKKTGQKVTQEKNVVKHRKKFPGYLFAEVEFNDRVLYLFRETSGVGDFVGASMSRAPSPMTDREVQSMLTGIVDPKDRKAIKAIKHKLDFEKGDKVRIREGAFKDMEGEVKQITEPKDKDESPKVTVEVTIFGRGVPVELDYWQVDKV